jgi:hypothetical protein
MQGAGPRLMQKPIKHPMAVPGSAKLRQEQRNDQQAMKGIKTSKAFRPAYIRPQLPMAPSSHSNTGRQPTGDLSSRQIAAAFKVGISAIRPLTSRIDVADVDQGSAIANPNGRPIGKLNEPFSPYK